MSNPGKRSKIEAITVFLIISSIAALISGYLTFKVQFERRKDPPVKKTKELSFQTLRIKEQERKQKHDHFHLLTQDPSLHAWQNKSSCVICHSPYPHGKDKEAVAVMNLHTEFLTCQSCHIKVNENETLEFGWINPTGKKTKGKPYGVRIDPDSGEFAETDDHISKLTPLVNTGGRKTPITSIEGSGEAQRYMTEKDSYSASRKKEIKDRLHRGTELKEFVKCSRCHSKNGLMDFAGLGFEPTRINQLEKMEIGGMMTNYDIFYFPDIFEKKFK